MTNVQDAKAEPATTEPGASAGVPGAKKARANRATGLHAQPRGRPPNNKVWDAAA